MALDIRTKQVTKNDDIYSAVYEIFDTGDPDTVLFQFSASGTDQNEIKAKLTEYINRKKAEYQQQAAWIALSDGIIEQLKTEGVI
jgi:hypothetical protein